MFSKRLFLPTIILAIVTLSVFQACSTSNSAINPQRPQIYLNSYQDVIDAVNQGLKQADMRAVEAKSIDDNTYYVKYYNKAIDMKGGGNESNPESALMAELTIKKLDDNKTRITIKEEEQSGLSPGAFKENLGRDLLRELKNLLEHESEVQKETAM